MSELRIKKHKKTQSEYDKLKDKCFFSEQMEVLLNQVLLQSLKIKYKVYNPSCS